MKNVKAPTSDSYHEYLISSLQDPQEAAVYLEAALEEAEPGLLKRVIKNIAEAKAESNNLSDHAKLNYEKLEQCLSSGGGEEICSLIVLLDALGFRIVIAPKDID